MNYHIVLIVLAILNCTVNICTCTHTYTHSDKTYKPSRSQVGKYATTKPQCHCITSLLTQLCFPSYPVLLSFLPSFALFLTQLCPALLTLLPSFALFLTQLCSLRKSFRFLPPHSPIPSPLQPSSFTCEVRELERFQCVCVVCVCGGGARSHSSLVAGWGSVHTIVSV